MTAERHRRAMSVFLAVCDADRSEREAILARECGGDDALRAEVESLLAFDERSDGLADGRVLATKATQLPERIGDYRILGILGRGGMGVVYQAQQQQPSRVVALKVMAPGMASPRALRRFGLEAEILGRLQHPGIAQIYEAGTADAGFGPQPFFAMELVAGTPITAFARDLDARAKVELLVKVCDAVDYAHHRGVIHRDLKPGNILVTSAGQPKVLDFGVARVIDDEARDVTAVTAVGHVVGTVAYMSTEQAVGDPAAVDLRTDVYALGALGYELLAGELPIAVSACSAPEALRRVVEEEPRPLAQHRSELRGDLDTIFAKVLRKRRDERYASAAEFAADLRRFLADEPITARPPSTLYQVRKFARRHRALVHAAALVFATVLVGLVVTVRMYLVAEEARVRAERQARIASSVREFLVEVLSEANPETNPGASRMSLREVVELGAAKVADRFADEPELRAVVQWALGQTLSGLGAYDAAATVLRRALDQQVDGAATALDRIELGSDLALALTDGGDLVAGEAAARVALAQLEQLDPEASRSHALKVLGTSLLRQERWADAQATFTAAIEDLRRQHRTHTPEFGSALTSRGNAALGAGNLAEAELDLTAAVQLLEQVQPAAGRTLLNGRNSRAALMLLQGKLDAAERELRAVVAAYESILPTDHPTCALSVNTLCGVLIRQRRYAEAEAGLRRAAAAWERGVGRDTGLASMFINLAYCLNAQGARQEAVDLYEQGLAIRAVEVPTPSVTTANALLDLARIKRALSDFDGEIDALQRSLPIARQVFGAEHPAVLVTEVDLAQRLAERGRPADCLAVLDRVATELAELGEAHASVGRATRLRAAALHATGHPEAAAADAAWTAWRQRHQQAAASAPTQEPAAPRAGG